MEHEDWYNDWKPVIKDFIQRGIKVDSTDRFAIGRAVREHKERYFSSLPTKYNHFAPETAKYVKCPTSHDLIICAPEKDMDTKGKKKIGFQWLTQKTITFPDPVVLKPIKGGFLILTAWGDEASDELVVNHKFN